MQTRMLLTKRTLSPRLPRLRRTHSPFTGTRSLRLPTPHHEPPRILLPLPLLLHCCFLLSICYVHRSIARCHIYFYFSLLFFYQLCTVRPSQSVLFILTLSIFPRWRMHHETILGGGYRWNHSHHFFTRLLVTVNII